MTFWKITIMKVSAISVSWGKIVKEYKHLKINRNNVKIIFEGVYLLSKRVYLFIVAKGSRHLPAHSH